MDEFRVQALRDEKTGLPNGRGLRAWLEENAEAEPLAILLLDFDGLGAVNNALGPSAGDELIRRVAFAITETLQPGELLARLHGAGGDEFVLCCTRAEARQAELRASSLEAQLDALDLPETLAGHYGGVSVGFTVHAEDEDPIAGVERAAAVMRERKRARKAAAGVLVPER